MIEPLSPADCDLRGYDFMPLFGTHLFGSEFYERASGDAFRAGIKLWWTAWTQKPAGSLPNDDLALCRYADMGRDMKGWKAIKAQALHGFVLCDDGRLYHPFLCTEAIKAWKIRLRQREKQAEYRHRKNGDGYGNAGPKNNPHPPVDNSSVTITTGESYGNESSEVTVTDGQSYGIGHRDVTPDRTGQDSKASKIDFDSELALAACATANSRIVRNLGQSLRSDPLHRHRKPEPLKLVPKPAPADPLRTVAEQIAALEAK